MRFDRPIRNLLNVFIVLFLAVSGYLVYWQVNQASVLAASPYNPRSCVKNDIPKRGTIFDRNGKALAFSVEDNKSPCGWRRQYADNTLSPVIGYYDPQGYGITGLELAYDDILSGRTTDTTNTSISDGIQQSINKLEHIRTYGTDVYLTIDDNIQKIASTSFNDPKLRACSSQILSDSKRGSVIVSDPKSGEILAMVSNPSFDSNQLVDHKAAADGGTDQNGVPLTTGQEYFATLLKNPDKPLINRPVSSLLVPGSVFKTVTLIAALDSGKYTTGSTFTQDEALSYSVDGIVINSNNLNEYTNTAMPPTFPIDLIHNYAYSNNVAFARLAVGVGQDTWLNYAQRFGISSNTTLVNLPTDLPLSHSWVYKPGKPFDTAALASAGYGQATLQVTPLVMSTIVSTVAADGKEYAPHIVAKTVPPGTDPTTIGNIAPNLVQQAFSAQTAQGVRTAMRAVVKYGSVGASGSIFSQAINSPVKMGGKTGTGQIDQGNYSEAWFISLAPDDTDVANSHPPVLSVVVQREEGGEGTCQSPIAENIYEQALPLVGYALK